jgi:hypothetical protein
VTEPTPDPVHQDPEAPKGVSTWEAVDDPDEPGFYYYWNTESNETVWELPAGLVPPKEAGPILML